MTTLSNLFEQLIDAIKNHDVKNIEKTVSHIEQKKLPPFSQQLYNKLIQQIEDHGINFNTIVEQIKAEENNKFEQKTLSDLEKRQVLPGISLVSCSMNRNENLLTSLESWLQLNVDEIIIIDWSSQVPVSEALKHINDERIKIIRVNGEKHWILSYAFNIGLRFAKYEKIYKLDADIKVKPNFLEQNHIDKNQFVRGSWKIALEQNNPKQIHVNGSFGCHKVHLQEIGYFNEYIRTYGWDDSNLYQRLAYDCGLGQKFLSPDSLVHIEQKNSDRLLHQQIKTHFFLEQIDATEFNNFTNMYIANILAFWPKQLLQDYQIELQSQNIWESKRITQDIPIPAYVINDAESYSALFWLKSHKNEWTQKTQYHKELGYIFYQDYKFDIPLTITTQMLGLEDGVFVIFNQPLLLLSDFLIQHSDKTYILIPSNQSYFQTINHNNKIFYLRFETLDNIKISLKLRHDILKTELSRTQLKSINSMTPVAFDEFELSKFNTTQSQTKKLYIDAQHGLGNRLRAIASAYCIAKKNDMDLIIIWEADHHCDCELTDLFEYSDEHLNKSFISQINSQSFDTYNYMEAEKNSNKDQEIILGDKHLYIRSAYSLNHQDVQWDQENEFIRSLKPVQKILDLVANVAIDSETIAAHIRMEGGQGLDKHSYESADNWSEESHIELQYWRGMSHYSHFIKRINQLLTDNKQKLFIATDMPETYQEFKNIYGTRLVYLKRDVFDRSKEQLQYALADVLLLSRCKKLLGSSWSSFSELAMRLSETYSSIELSGKDF